MIVRDATANWLTFCLVYEVLLRACSSQTLRNQSLSTDFADSSIAVDPTLQGFWQAFQGLRIASGALPNGEYTPAHFYKLLSGALVAIDICLQFGCPKRRPRGRRFGIFAPLVGVPEASVHEDRYLAARHRDVGSARQVTTMQSEAVPQCEQRLAYQHLRQGVFAPDAGHHLAAFRGADDVDHGGSKHWPF